jgi:integrase
MELTAMASPARARHGSYIFQRPGSPNWYVQLRSPDGRKVVSLHTADKLTAENAALPMIAEHKAKLLAARPRFDTVWKHAMEPGREHAGPDGAKIVATDRELIHIGHNGNVTRIEPNGGRALQLVSNNEHVGESNWRLGAAFLNDDGSPRFDKAARPAVATKTGDDALFDNYVKHGARKGRGLDGYPLKEATAVWELFRQLTNGKALKDCDKSDGRLLVAHYQAEKLQLPSIQKKVNWLCAMVEFYNAEKKPDQPALFNPFSGIVPQRTVQEKQAAKRKSLSDADVKACKAKLGTLSDKDQLLFRLLEATGMRLSEAFQIKHEEPRNGGPRFVVIGNKTENSLRRVPLPKSVLPYLPATISAPLFTGDIKATSRRFTEFLRETVKIKDPKKVLYSLRHRAKDRARDLEFPDKIGEAIFGRDDGKETGDDYGEGYSIHKLKTWIDKISIL